MGKYTRFVYLTAIETIVFRQMHASAIIFISKNEHIIPNHCLVFWPVRVQQTVISAGLEYAFSGSPNFTSNFALWKARKEHDQTLYKSDALVIDFIQTVLFKTH